MKRAVLIFTMIFLGILLPIGHHLTFLVRYFVMVMLFFAFLNIKLEKDILSIDHLKVLVFNILLPIVFYYSISWLSLPVAAAAFAIASAPTAAGAPVIAVFLKKDVRFVTTSVIITSPVIALILPFTLAYVLKIEAEISIMELLQPIAFVVFIPLILAQSIRYFSEKYL
ncbi:MAG: hypothetical protein AAFO07_19890, partial [Bacteroidota bacterium]